MTEPKYQGIKNYWTKEIWAAIWDLKMTKWNAMPWHTNLSSYGEIDEIERYAHKILNDIWTEYEKIWNAKNASAWIFSPEKKQKPNYPNEEYTTILNNDMINETNKNNQQQEDINNKEKNTEFNSNIIGNPFEETAGESSSSAQAQPVPVSVYTTPEPPEIIAISLPKSDSEDNDGENEDIEDNQAENDEPQRTFSSDLSFIHNLFPEIFSHYEEQLDEDKRFINYRINNTFIEDYKQIRDAFMNSGLTFDKDSVKELSEFYALMLSGGLFVGQFDDEEIKQRITRLKEVNTKLTAMNIDIMTDDWETKLDSLNATATDKTAEDTNEIGEPVAEPQDPATIITNLQKELKTKQDRITELEKLTELMPSFIEKIETETGIDANEEGWANELTTLIDNAKKYQELVEYQATVTQDETFSDNSTILETVDGKTTISQDKLTRLITNKNCYEKILTADLGLNLDSETLANDINDLQEASNREQDLLAHLQYDKTANDGQKIAGKYYTDLDNVLPTYINGDKVSLVSGLVHRFRELFIITGDDGLDVWTDGAADRTKIKVYQDSKKILTDLGLDLTTENWATDLTAKLNGAKISDIPADTDLSKLITAAADLTTLQANYKILDDKLTEINNDLNILDSKDNLKSKLRTGNVYTDLKTAKVGIDEVIRELGLNPRETFLPKNWHTRLVNKEKLDNAQAELTRLNGEINKIATDLTGLIDTVDDKKRVNDAKLATLKGFNDGSGVNLVESRYNSLLNTLNYTPQVGDTNDHADLWKDLKVTLNGRNLPQLIQALNDRESQIKTALLRPQNDSIPSSWHQITEIFLKYFLHNLKINNPNNLPAIPAGESLNSLLARPTAAQLITANQTITQLKNDKINLQTDKTFLTTQRDNEKNRADNLQAWKNTHNCLDGHTCPQCQVTKHDDYDTIKQERDALQTENTQLKAHECDCTDKIKAKESEIITKIITDLQLSTKKERENVLDTVITEIKTKITPPADNGKDNKISELQQQLTQKEQTIKDLQTPKSLKDLTVSSEAKTEIAKLSQDFGLTNSQFAEKLKGITSYHQLASLQNKVFKEELSKEASDKSSAITLNYCLGALSIGSLLVLFYLLIKRTSFILPEKEKKE